MGQPRYKLDDPRPMVFVIDGPGDLVKLRLCTPTEVLYDIELDFDEIRELNIKTSKALWAKVHQLR